MLEVDLEEFEKSDRIRVREGGQRSKDRSSVPVEFEFGLQGLQVGKSNCPMKFERSNPTAKFSRGRMRTTRQVLCFRDRGRDERI